MCTHITCLVRVPVHEYSLYLWICILVDLWICVYVLLQYDHFMICMYVSLHCMCQSGQIIFHRTAEHYLRNNLCNTLFLVPHFWGKLCNCQTKCTCHLIIDLFPTLKNLTVLNIALNNLQLKYGVCINSGETLQKLVKKSANRANFANRANCKSRKLQIRPPVKFVEMHTHASSHCLLLECLIVGPRNILSKFKPTSANLLKIIQKRDKEKDH